MHADMSLDPAPFSEPVHPRPQLRRREWTELSGTWEFAHDDEDRGRLERWHNPATVFEAKITVPFPPESPASGVGEPGYHPVVWYRRTLTQEDLAAAGYGSQGGRLLLHFGAVDYRADVWLGGQYLGHHEGGHTPFSFDISDLVIDGAWQVVVRAEDDPLDVAQPRGKQDWETEPHGIWYGRTTGIWQPVWLEAVPVVHVADLAWESDVPAGTVDMSLDLGSRPTAPVTVSVSLTLGGEALASVQFQQAEPRSRTTITLARQANGQNHESLLWSPEHPRLVEAQVTVTSSEAPGDHVASYFGMRSVGWSHGHFVLNNRPYYVRAVLEQGYWPETHLASPHADALREEVQLAKDLGFNTVRIHQKVEDPRYLYWADRLGLLVWGESASAYEFSPTAVERTTREWLDTVRRDRSHPCIVVWVPLNESWGVQHISHDPRQLDYARALYHATKALDPTRPVVTNDGWEHADSDLWTIHDYSVTGPDLAASYQDAGTVRDLLGGVGPLGRALRLLDVPDRGQPVIVSEFGGVSFAPSTDGAAWGYATATESEDFEALLRELFRALQSSPVLAGYCYTQLTDTLQEANGLTDPQRRPKLPVETIRGIVLGEGLDISWQRRPKSPSEEPHPDSGQRERGSREVLPPVPRARD